MSISPRNTPPGPLSTRNQSGRSERADGSGLRNPARAAADTPALASSRSKALAEDVGRADRRVMSGVDTATPGPLPSPGASPSAPGAGTIRPVGASAGRGARRADA